MFNQEFFLIMSKCSLSLGKAPEFEIGGFDEQGGLQAIGLFSKYS